jgi:hypothetical protein
MLNIMGMTGNEDVELFEALFIFSLEFSQLLLIKQVVTCKHLPNTACRCPQGN